MTDLTDARTALERGRPVIVVTPPAVEAAGAVWDLLETPALIVCADADAAACWAAAVPAATPPRRVHAVTSLGRSTAVLRRPPPASPVDVVAGAPKDLAALLERSVLKLEAVRTVVLAWPECIQPAHTAALDALLAELPEARRLVLSWDPGQLRDFLERHARRAEVVGALPVDADGRPLPPVAGVRAAVVAAARRAAAVTAWLDAADPTPHVPFIWSGGSTSLPAACDAVLCTRLPTREELQALAALAPVTIFVTATQLPYLRSVAAVTAFRLPSAADRAQDRAEQLGVEVAALLESGNVDAELMLLAPLFERFDPAAVAAALLQLRVRPEETTGQIDPPPAATKAGKVRVFVNLGKKDQVGPKDLVGALTREVGIDKGAIGKIEVRETFCVVEIGADTVDRAVRGLSKVTIRNRRVLARLDRDH